MKNSNAYFRLISVILYETITPFYKQVRSLINLLWVKIGNYAFEMFTQIYDFP